MVEFKYGGFFERKKKTSGGQKEKHAMSAIDYRLLEKPFHTYSGDVKKKKPETESCV